MSFAAVICASHAANDIARSGETAPLRSALHFAGNSLVEYQVRQAAEAGASRVMILVSAVTQPLSRAIDRLIADGINVALVRDMVTLVRETSHDQDMLLVGDGAIVAQNHYAVLVGHTGNAVLVTADSHATAGFERIDAGQRWAGLVKVSPELLFGTLDMLGDWDLELTLLRAAVQGGAARAMVPQEDVLEGRVALIDRQSAADLVAQALLGGKRDGTASHLAAQGGVEYYVLGYGAAWIAPSLLRGQVPAQQVRIAGTAIAAMAIVAIWLGWSGTGLILMLFALTSGLSADRLAELARRDRQDGWMALAPAATVLAGIAIFSGELEQGLDGLYLALLLGISLIASRSGGVPYISPWAFFTPGSAILLLLVALLLGEIGTGLALAIILAIGSIGYRILQGRQA